MMARPPSRIFEAFYSEVAELNAMHNVFRELFGYKTNIDIFNRVSGPAARMIEDSLFDSILLHICRLIESPSQGDKARLTTSQVINSLADHLKPSARRGIDETLAQLRELAPAIFQHRDERIAHRNLAKAIAEKPDWKQIQFKDVAKACRLLADFINLIEAVFSEAVSDFAPQVFASEAAGIPVYLELGLYAEDIARRVVIGDLTATQGMSLIRRKS